MQPTELDYYDGKNELPEGAIRISASSFHYFVNRPWQWYKEQILGIGGFEGNEASIIGTIVHYCAEMKAQNKEPNIDEIKRYIDNNATSEEMWNSIEKHWKPMAMEVINNYVLKHKHLYTSIEEFITYQLTDNLYIGGSVDFIENNSIIGDYKTTSGKVPDSIPPHYKQQLLVYAWVLQKLKRPMKEMRLVYITKPQDTRRISEKTGKPIGKYTPSTLTVLTEPITQSDLDWIDSMINLCVDKLLYTEQHPETLNMIWHAPSKYWEE